MRVVAFYDGGDSLTTIRFFEAFCWGIIWSGLYHHIFEGRAAIIAHVHVTSAPLARMEFWHMKALIGPLVIHPLRRSPK